MSRKSSSRRNSASHRRRRGSGRRHNADPVPGPSYVEHVLSALERALFSFVSLVIRNLPTEYKLRFIVWVLRFLIRHFISTDTYNIWDRLFDHVKSHHVFHRTCHFTHVGRFVLPKVRNQGKLATCFIISSCGAVSSLIRCLKRFWVVLSVQQLIDNFDVTEKNGGLTSDAYDFIEYNGIVEEQYYPFTGAKDTPQNPKNCRRFFIGGYKYLGRRSIEVDKSEIERAPVTATMAYYSSYWSYKKGVIDVPRSGMFEGMHSVIITGFGLHKGREYFEFQSSHGYDWGTLGSGKVFAELLSDFRVPISAGDKTVVNP